MSNGWLPPPQLPQQAPVERPGVPDDPAPASVWRRIRRLPLLGQIGIWVGVALVSLAALGAIIGPAKPRTTDTAGSNSATDATVEVSTAAAITTVSTTPPSTAPAATNPIETTTTLQSRQSAIAAGNVAACRDGGFSANTNFSATCSSAGDVSEWLASYGECQDGKVIQMNEDASCDSNDGFKGLMPADYAPPTTTVPPTTVPVTVPPTTPPPTIPNFGGGTQLVGVDIQSGVYVTTSIDGFGCYWERLSDVSGDFSAIIANANLSPGAQGMVEISATDVAFNSSGCGRWVVFLPPPAATTSFADGVWIVGQQIVPGRYRSEPIDSFGCYWARLSGVSGEFVDIIANDNVAEGSAIVQIKPSDRAIESSGCGNWTLVG